MVDDSPSSVYQINKLKEDRKNDQAPQPRPAPPGGVAGPNPQMREEFAREQARIAERESRIRHMQDRLAENKGKARDQFRKRSR